MKFRMKSALARCLICVAVLFTCMEPAVSEAPVLSTHHHIYCRSGVAGVLFEGDNDTSGVYYSTTNHIIFLDKATHKMTRIGCSCCVETWDPKDGAY